jgi:RhoGAP domain
MCGSCTQCSFVTHSLTQAHSHSFTLYPLPAYPTLATHTHTHTCTKYPPLHTHPPTFKLIQFSLVHGVELDELPPLEVGLMYRRFLIKLRYPMLTTFMYAPLLAAMNIPSQTEQSKALSKLLQALPPENLDAVKSVLRLLSLICINAENEVVSLMLAVGYAPMLIRESEITVEKASQPVVAAMETFIANFDYFFLNQPLKSPRSESASPEVSFMQRHKKLDAFHAALESASKAISSSSPYVCVCVCVECMHVCVSRVCARVCGVCVCSLQVLVSMCLFSSVCTCKVFMSVSMSVSVSASVCICVYTCMCELVCEYT